MTATETAIQPRRKATFKPIRPGNLVFRILTTWRHLIAMTVGCTWVWLNERRERKLPRKWRYGLLRMTLFPFYLFLDQRIVGQSMGAQIRIRLERLGATYVKLGQIMSLRSDILPGHITDELKKLLDDLPAMSYEDFVREVERHLEQRWSSVFARIAEFPEGSASIAQAHAATLNNGDDVIIKLLKPGTRELILMDSRILRGISGILEFLVPVLQPKAMIGEFCGYTEKETDFQLEALNAIEFANNFTGVPEIVFPKIYRDLSNSNVLVMEFIDGLKPDAQTATILSEEQKNGVVDNGALAIIKMMFEDGFFHADLHPGNLRILSDNRCAFIDLGMAGRFTEATRKNMLYYYNALVLGRPEAAARYLSFVARPGRRGDIQGFRTEFARVATGWIKEPNFNQYSMAKLILESTRLGAKYQLYFPIELILMVKALVTFEGVGHVIQPNLNVAQISRKHMRRMLIREVKPTDFLKSTLQNAPELMDTLSRGPVLLVELFNRMEQEMNHPLSKGAPGIASAILSGFALVGACVVYGMGGQPIAYLLLLLLALVLFLRSR